jgi:Kef-type K+ transport system membrane component KefB
MTGFTYLILFLLIIALAAIVPQALRKYHIPHVISLLLVGMAIGPNAMDLIGLLATHFARGYPVPQMLATIDGIGMLGLIFLMALAGMEVDLGIVRREKKAVCYLSLLTFALPAAAGYFVYAFFCPDDYVGKLLYASLFASHSVGVVFAVIRELQIAQTRFGVAVLASTVITDIASLILLAVCVQLKRHQTPGQLASISIFDHIPASALGGAFLPIFLAVILLYILLSFCLVPRLGTLLLGRIQPGDETQITFFLLVVLIVVFVGELIGVSVVVGAFVAGMGLSRVRAVQHDERALHRRLERIGYGLIIPFLFISIGMQSDLRVLWSGDGNFAIVSLTVIGLVGSKMFSGWLAMRLAGFGNDKSICAGLMTVPQLSATLAAAAVGRELGILNAQFFNAIIVLSVLTTLPAPVLVKLFILRRNIQFTHVDEDIGNISKHAGGEDLL